MKAQMLKYLLYAETLFVQDGFVSNNVVGEKGNKVSAIF
jgi:hypothetical protein